jgi:hypothetical protein
MNLAITSYLLLFSYEHLPGFLRPELFDRSTFFLVRITKFLPFDFMLCFFFFLA